MGASQPHAEHHADTGLLKARVTTTSCVSTVISVVFLRLVATMVPVQEFLGRRIGPGTAKSCLRAWFVLQSAHRVAEDALPLLEKSLSQPEVSVKDF